MKKCNNFSSIGEISDNEIYIDEEPQNDQNINDISLGVDEDSLKNISWIESVEQELSSSMDTKTFMCCSGKHEKNDTNDKNKSNEPSQIINDVNALINAKYNDLSDLGIMEYQTLIINCLRKQIKSKEVSKCNIDDILIKVTWLFDTSKYLSQRLGLPNFHHKNTDGNVVSRSSYKFCNYNFECQFNYNLKKHYGCFAQHYVHNLVSADLDALKLYILHNKQTINIAKLEEIKKSINTISYVIGHMYEELQNAQKFNFFNTNNNHIERTPKKKKCKSKLVTA